MKLDIAGDKLQVTDIKELGAANAHALKDQVRAKLTPAQTHIEVDLSETIFVDSCGLGVLVGLHETACRRNGGLRLLNPRPPVRQMLNLTRMNRIFEIVEN